jgi:hypothetical protein
MHHRTLRRGLRLCMIVAGLVAALAIPSLAAADTFINASAAGRTIPLGNGTFQISGTFVDGSGAVGTYVGRYTQLTTGYTSCRATGLSEGNCGTSFFPYRCNLVSGVVTLRTAGAYVTLNIGSAFFAPPLSRLWSGVCLKEGSTTERDTYLLLTNRTALWPATVEEFSSGYGLLAYAVGSLVGTSTPLGRSASADALTLELGLFGNISS